MYCSEQMLVLVLVMTGMYTSYTGCGCKHNYCQDDKI